MNYANIKFNDIANGEGVRVCLFVSGCTHHCKNCFNKETWDFNYGKEFNKQVEDRILEAVEPDYVNGLTLLGGEPMEPANQKALLDFVKRFKKHFPKKTIWCYTGFLFDDLYGEGRLVVANGDNNFVQALTDKNRCHCPWTRKFLSYIDILVDGEFMEDLKDITLRFKGSSNQRVIDVQKSLQLGKIVLDDFNNKKNF